jgi:chromosome segregation ATPase
MQRSFILPAIVVLFLASAVAPTLTYGRDGDESGSKSQETRLAERKTEQDKKAAEALKKAKEVKAKSEKLEKREKESENETETESEKSERKTRTERISAGCEKIEAKITTVLDRHETAKEKHLANQDRLYTRGTELSKKLKAAGYDTAKLDTDLTTFKGKLDLVKSTFSAYSASLTATQQYTCGESEGAFKTQLQDSRDLYKAFREDLKDARDFWKAVVMVDIKALKEQATATASPSATASPAN